MALEAPDILEIEQVCDFAETRLEQISEAVSNGDEDPLGDWEGNCLPRVRAWLQQMKQVDASIEERTKLATAQLRDDNYGVETMLVISTAHVTEETAKTLDMGSLPFGLVCHAKADYGWMIFVGSEEAEENTAPDELDALIQHCRKLGIDWLCLDRDAAEHPEFSIFDW